MILPPGKAEASVKGYLQISEVKNEQGEDGEDSPVILGIVRSDAAAVGGWHPVLIQGNAAKHTLDMARRWELQRRDRPPLVHVEGKLLSGEKNLVVVRHIDFIDLLGAHDDLLLGGVEGELVNVAPLTPAGQFECAGVRLRSGSRIDLLQAGRWLPGHIEMVDGRFVFVPHGEPSFYVLVPGLRARRPPGRNGHR